MKIAIAVTIKNGSETRYISAGSCETSEEGSIDGLLESTRKDIINYIAPAKPIIVTRYQCPRCGSDVDINNVRCSDCSALMDWGDDYEA